MFLCVCACLVRGGVRGIKKTVVEYAVEKKHYLNPHVVVISVRLLISIPYAYKNKK